MTSRSFRRHQNADSQTAPNVDQDLSSHPRTVRIERRFRGPPRSGNGGYVCGLLAEHLAGDCVVRLLCPPPLDRDLLLADEDDGVVLLDGERPIARARPHELHLELPAAVPLEEARLRSRHYRGFEEHAFPGCFVCGPERQPGDGLRIFAGAGKDGRVAGTWRPDPSLAGSDGNVRRRFVWAALDCPSGWAYLHAGARVAVLGEFAAHIAAPVRAGEEVAVIGWRVGDDGRKHRTASALFTADGTALAWAAATWFDVDPAALHA